MANVSPVISMIVVKELLSKYKWKNVHNKCVWREHMAIKN